LRVDLDYVPWDSPDARDFGHGEPAVFLRMMDFARSGGFKFHFFASNRLLQAFPSIASTALEEGHALDWFCKRPDEAAVRWERALPLFEALGSVPMGFSCKGAWVAGTCFAGLETMKFLSAHAGPKPEGLELFPVETKSAREAMRSGMSVKTWSDAAKVQIRESTSRQKGVTLVLRPQVLGRYDPKLIFLREILDLAVAVGAAPMTLRSVVGA
jgi:hypothetical protein